MSVGSGIVEMSKPSPSSSIEKRASFGVTSATIRIVLPASNLLPCLTALTNASSKATKRFDLSGFTKPSFSTRFVK